MLKTYAKNNYQNTLVNFFYLRPFSLQILYFALPADLEITFFTRKSDFS